MHGVVAPERVRRRESAAADDTGGTEVAEGLCVDMCTRIRADMHVGMGASISVFRIARSHRDEVLPTCMSFQMSIHMHVYIHECAGAHLNISCASARRQYTGRVAAAGSHLDAAGQCQRDCPIDMRLDR